MMDGPVGEREALWSWWKPKEDHAPTRPVHPSGTHPTPQQLSEPVYTRYMGALDSRETEVGDTPVWSKPVA